MVNNIIHIDDWNTIFRKIPETINEHTYEIMSNSNNYVDIDNYAVLKSRLTTMMKDIGNFEYINYATGDQAIINAIILCKKYLDVNEIYVVKEAFHGITLKSFRDGILNLEDVSISELELNRLEMTVETCSNNSLLLLEPFLFFAKYGNEGVEKVNSIVSKAKKNKMLVLFDEIRSGVFCTGTFLFSQQLLPIDVDFICFAKGLALGVSTSVLAIKTKIFAKSIINKEDILKSCMSISEVAMQRSNELLEYYMNNPAAFKKSLFSITKKIGECFDSFVNFLMVKQVNIIGLCCIFVFDENVKKGKLRLIRQYMLSKSIAVRHIEDNLLSLNFALDSTDDELCVVRDKMKEAIELSENY